LNGCHCIFCCYNPGAEGMSDYSDDDRERRGDSSSGTSWAVACGTLVFLFLLMLDSVWLNKVSYAVQYSVDMDKVFMEPQPHDCDFIKAPLGMKYCHYGKTVVTQPDQFPRGDGQVPGVYITWTKVQD
jgi:hypothetical protein